MAELTKQQSIKLLTLNKFRISAASTARSRSIKNPQNNIKSTERSVQGRYSEQTSPNYQQSQNFRKALLKIGALQRQDMSFTFVPDEKDHQTFRKRRLTSLKTKYFKERVKQDKAEPYDDQEIDDAALGCWSYGQSNTKKSVWRKYRENLNRLNFDTLNVLRKRNFS